MRGASVAKLGAAVATLAWTTFWFWAFSFAYSDSFFVYNRHSRIPTFVAALLIAVLIPWSAALQGWRFARSGRRGMLAILAHLGTCLVLLACLPAVSGVLRRSGPPWRASADDAMGVGIDFLMLLGLAVVSVIVLGAPVAVTSLRQRGRRPGPRSERQSANRMKTLKQSAQAVQRALDAAGLDCEVREFPASTRTAQEAAEAVGCPVERIAKSIVFKASESGRPVLVIASGANRIDPEKVKAALGEAIGRASPDFVREATGFAIGGVPPCGHSTEIEIFLDEAMLALPEVWAAAGTPNAVFCIRPEELVRLTAGRVIEVV